jgi:hypothetical protein
MPSEGILKSLEKSAEKIKSQREKLTPLPEVEILSEKTTEDKNEETIISTINPPEIVSLDSFFIGSFSNIEEITGEIKKIDKSITAQWFKLSHLLKEVRDNHLYASKYETFQEYCEIDLDYSRPMVYNFIKIAEQFPISTEKKVLELGVSKLISLSSLPDDVRQKLIDEVDLDKMTTREVKEEVKKLQVEEIINTSNHDKKFNLSLEEKTTIKSFNNNIDNFREIFVGFTEWKKEDDAISHQQAVYLRDILVKTKREMKRIEKIIKKYV